MGKNHVGWGVGWGGVRRDDDNDYVFQAAALFKVGAVVLCGGKWYSMVVRYTGAVVLRFGTVVRYQWRYGGAVAWRYTPMVPYVGTVVLVLSPRYNIYIRFAI